MSWYFGLPRKIDSQSCDFQVEATLTLDDHFIFRASLNVHRGMPYALIVVISRTANYKPEMISSRFPHEKV